MIIYFNKNDGHIVGTMGGRVHKQPELNMFIGSREDNDRIVCQWLQNNDGVYEPNIQKDIFMALDKDINLLNKYKVNTATRKLELKI